jgi:hypothetical protein
VDTIAGFAKALKRRLTDRHNAFTSIVQGEGGCETCGHGAPEYHDLDFDALLGEIDEFAATFKAARKPSR